MVKRMNVTDLLLLTSAEKSSVGARDYAGIMSLQTGGLDKIMYVCLYEV